MKPAAAIIVCATWASAAGAQHYILSIEGAPEQVDLSQGAVTFDIDIIADVDDPSLGTHILSGEFALATTGDALVSQISWSPADWSDFGADGGYAGNGIYNTVGFGQDLIAGQTLDDGALLGSRVGTFSITLASQTQARGQFSISVLPSSFLTLLTIDSGTGASYYSTPDTLILRGLTTTIVPAPGAGLGLVMGAGAFGVRRRRG